MLKRLYIENIAIIDKLETEFLPGLCVLTGETGAGKSIIIDSINAVTGARVSHEIIRTGEKSARVSALFEDVSKEALKAAEAMGVSSPDGAILLDREIYLSGKNVCRINGFPATIQMLKDLGSRLININGQHDGLKLLDESLHIDYLDIFAQNENILSDYVSEYEKLLFQNRRIKALSLSESEKEKRLSEIEIILNDINAADIKENEWQELCERKEILKSEEKLVKTVSAALSILDGGEENPGACSEILTLSKLLQSSKISSCEPLAVKANDIFSSLAELSSSLSQLISKSVYSDEALRINEKRIGEYFSLSVKCGCSPEELFTTALSLSEERDTLLKIDENLDNLKEEYLKQRTVVTELASKLHASRINAAEKLSLQMEENMSYLSMPNARFSVEVTPLSTETQTRFTKKGTDNVVFLMSANKGEDLKPISKVASGGELSRIMLSFKNVVSKDDVNITAVFDEVDAGVSGKAASRVASMLSAVSEKRQVLCVTHLPQIASVADNHYRISKEVLNGRTVTKLEYLDKEGRIEDISRLMGGEKVTEVTKKSAEQMLLQSK